tara:strand:+ start:32751 stop:33803 length:1053 start_codon:yes stop_codon:yes gene_type:complete
LTDVILIGGGHSHALVLAQQARNPAQRLRLTLIDPFRRATYSGMVPGYLAGHYARRDLQIDLARLAARAQASFVQGHVSAIDPVAKRLSLILADGSRQQLPYDIAAFDIGQDHRPVGGMPPGDLRPVKPFDALCDAWDAFVSRPGPRRLCVLGAGAAGCELALAAAHRLGRHGQISLADRADRIVPTHGKALRHKLEHALSRAGIKLCLGSTGMDDVDLVIAATGGRPHAWLRRSGLCGPDGIPVMPTLLLRDHPDLFASGDCADFTQRPLAKAGVYAVRQAPILAENLRRHAMGRPLRPYRPQHDHLKLLSLGDHRAIADWHGLTASGRLPWLLKDHIDRAFMAQFPTA